MSYKFQSALFYSRTDLCNAIAGEWMTAGGLNSRQDVDDACTQGAESLAAECIDGWGLDQPESDLDPTTWMRARETDRDDIVRAFERFIATRPDIQARQD